MATNVSASVTEVLMAREGPILQMLDFSLSLRVLSFVTPGMVAKEVFVGYRRIVHSDNCSITHNNIYCGQKLYIWRRMTCGSIAVI